MATPLNRRLSRLILSARAAIAWERLWPAVAPMLGVLVVFASTAWMGLWIGLPPLFKAIGLVLFAVAFVAAGWRLARLTLPRREDAMRRLESDAALDHRPLSAYEDELAVGADSFSESIWRVHRRRAEARLSRLRFPLPRADLVPHDPFAVRSAVGILAFIGILVGAGALAERLLTPFDFSDPAERVAGAEFRLDAWVTPPAYTGRSPLFLSAATRVDTEDGIRVPAGSILTVRSQGADGMELVVTDAAGERAEPMSRLTAESEGGPVATEGTVEIGGPMTVEVRRDGLPLDGWQFAAQGDQPPTVRFLEAPASDRRQGFEVRYELNDDYGITSAIGVLTPVDAPEDRRPLVEDPTFRLALPGGRGMRGEARTTHDLSEHPYAGLMVALTLEATDGAGQTGRSEARIFRLPSRTFVNPLAKAVVEQRSILAMDANAHMDVVDTVDLLMLASEGMVGAGGYLAMGAAYRELVEADTDDDLRAVLGTLWELALLLEDDGMSDAERALQAAQERLRQALEDGASPEEIARLTQELREAMMNYMRQLAEQMQNQPQQQQIDPNAQTLTQQNLDDMLRRLEELAQQGRTAEAEALLNQLAQMMQNLQMAQRGQGQQGDPMGPDGRMLDELGRMIQRQQELMDETYRMDQQGQQQPGQQQGQRGENGQRPGGQMSPEERAEALRRLEEQQGQLQQELDDLTRRLEERGFEPGERLGDAGESMGEAGEELGRNQPGSAVGDQSEALQALREGAQGMAQQMAEAAQQPGEGEGMGPPDQGPGRDPLGRARREGSVADTSRVQIPDEIETQRARRILQELRERLGDMDLPRLEREYLERLLP